MIFPQGDMELPSVPTDELPDVPESSEKRAGLMIIRYSFVLLLCARCRTLLN